MQKSGYGRFVGMVALGCMAQSAYGVSEEKLHEDLVVPLSLSLGDTVAAAGLEEDPSDYSIQQVEDYEFEDTEILMEVLLQEKMDNMKSNRYDQKLDVLLLQLFCIQQHRVLLWPLWTEEWAEEEEDDGTTQE